MKSRVRRRRPPVSFGTHTKRPRRRRPETAQSSKATLRLLVGQARRPFGAGASKRKRRAA